MKNFLFICIAVCLLGFIGYKWIFVSNGNPPSLKGSFRIGVTAGPHAEIMQKVKEVAKKQGFDIEITEFNDFILPNQALDQKELDANCYQHEAFLKEQVATRGLALVSVASSVVMPMGAYSKTLKSIEDLQDQATIAIPNDPSNEARALKLLEQQGLLTLKKVDNPSVADVADNPKRFSILTLEAPQLPRTLEDVDLAVINTDWVLLSGLDFTSALFGEDKKSPYANVIVVRAQDRESKRVKDFVTYYQCDEIKSFIQQRFKGAVIPAW